MLLPIDEFRRIYRERRGRTTVSAARLRQEISTMWSMVADYEREHGLVTVDYKASYYGRLQKHQRAQLQSKKAPSFAVVCILHYVPYHVRTADCDIAEMRRMVVQFMQCEE